MVIKSDPWVLGIGASPHNGAVCLLKGDEIIVAIQEERLSRMKRAALFAAQPSLSLEYCLNYAGIRPADLSLVVCCVTNEAKIPEQDLLLNPILQPGRHQIPTLYISHHLGHAVSAFATSGLNNSAVLVIDGKGSPFEDLNAEEKASCKWMVADGCESISLYEASGTTINSLEKHLVVASRWVGPERDGMPTFESLGGMYAAAARQIFGDLLEAGKVMGLAPYGTPDIPVGEFFDIEDGQIVFHDRTPKRFKHVDRWPSRQKEYANLASSTQAALEEAVLYFTDHLHKLSASEHLCYAGGVALNSVANERIIRESAFKTVYIFPAAEDSGAAIGAAYYGLWELTGRNTRKKLAHDAVGKSYSDQEVLTAVEATPAVEITPAADSIGRTVELLCDGKILGWFDGRSELGPRALGQRSILCDPRHPDAKEILNSRVKHRESFRPFAPVVLLENVQEWFDLDGITPESPFMLRICRFNEERKGLVPGVVHVDDTGRFQTVTADANGALYDLVKRFYERTGVPIILNTSFNVAGEPIVETPQDALNTMLATGIDYCIFPNRIVGKRREILFEPNEVPWPQRLNRQITEALKAPAAAGSSGPGILSGPAPERSLASCVGSFAHNRQGRLTIEQSGGQLKATLTGELTNRLIPKRSALLKRIHQDTFEVAGGPLSGFKIIFLPDKRGRVNQLAALTPASEIFFRVPDASAAGESFYEQLLGTYRDSDKRLVVALQDRRLIVSADGQDGFELARTRGHEFVLKGLPGYGIEFNVDGAGPATTAIVTQPNEVIVLARA